LQKPRLRGAPGYTLVALVIGMAVLTILLAAVGPMIATVMKRDREEELIFRGRQYARAIVLFQRRYGRYPNTLKEMFENRPRTIRKLWKDPMCACDDWKLLIAGTPDAMIALPNPGQQPGAGLPPRPTPTPGPFDKPGETVGPIAGVRSKVHRDALRQWRGLKYYDEWSFIAGNADSDQQTAERPNRAPLPGIGQPKPNQ
jgi:type II secretory pathway pseudopilin PulG